MRKESHRSSPSNVVVLPDHVRYQPGGGGLQCGLALKNLLLCSSRQSVFSEHAVFL